MDIKLEKKSSIRRSVKFIPLFILLAFVIWKGLFAESTQRYRTDENKISIAKVVTGNFEDYITMNGTVAPISTIYMDAYVGGRVTEKLIDEGTMVKKGDVILTLENRLLYEQILNSENNLALKQNDLRSTKLAFDARQVNGQKDMVNAEYELKKLKRNFEQNSSLYNEGLIAKEVYLVAKENYELSQKQHDIISQQSANDKVLRNTSLMDLEADLSRMKNTLSMIYERIDQLNVRAPADGQLGYLDAEIGQSIDQGERIGQINVLTDYKIEATMDEHYIDRVQRGLTAILERNDIKYNLKVRKIFPEVRDGKFRIDLVFTDTKPENIRAGLGYNLKLQFDTAKEAIMIPKGSFFQSSGGQYIFVVDESGEFATKRSVQFGKQNTRFLEVTIGLMPGESVIISDYEKFGEADKVIIDN